MPKKRESASELRKTLNQILSTVEEVLPSLGPCTDQESPAYIERRVWLLVQRHLEIKALQDQAVALFRALNRLS